MTKSTTNHSQNNYRLEYGSFLIVLVLVTFFCFWAVPPGFSSQSHDESIKRAKFLEKKGEHEVARKILQNLFHETDDLAVLNEWIDLDRKIFHDLSLLNKQKLLHSRFNPEKIYPKGEILKEFGKSFLINPWSPILSTISSWDSIWDVEIRRKKIIQFESDNPYPTIFIDEARKDINLYDVLKRSCNTLVKNLDFLLERPDVKNVEDLLKIKSELNDHFKQVAFTRSNYISYDVISPSLNRTKQLIFLAENAKILSIGHSSDLLREAVKVMEQGAYHEIILQAHQDVRDEFLEVYKLLKNTAGSAEFEELKVFGTLQDKISRERMLGYERWQNQ